MHRLATKLSRVRCELLRPCCLGSYAPFVDAEWKPSYYMSKGDDWRRGFTLLSSMLCPEKLVGAGERTVYTLRGFHLVQSARLPTMHFFPASFSTIIGFMR